MDINVTLPDPSYRYFVFDAAKCVLRATCALCCLISLSVTFVKDSRGEIQWVEDDASITHTTCQKVRTIYQRGMCDRYCLRVCVCATESHVQVICDTPLVPIGFNPILGDRIRVWVARAFENLLHACMYGGGGGGARIFVWVE